MANHKATGKKAARGAEMVQRIRGAILNALDTIEKNKGMPISEVLAQEYENNPSKLIELASKYAPKDINMDATVHEQYAIAYQLITDRSGVDSAEDPKLEDKSKDICH